MPERLLSAPGKQFVAGEYAVLWGGQAWVLAVDSRVAGLVRKRADRTVTLALDEGCIQGEVTPAGVHWRSEVSRSFHFAARTIDLACRVLGREGPGFSIAFESSPAVQGAKPGFGGSARATVLTAELVRWATESSYDALKLALVAHVEAQQGRGSGADVAACFSGGLISYRQFDARSVLKKAETLGLGASLRAAPPVDLNRVEKISLPMLYVYSGTSALTPSLITRAEQQLSSEQRAAFVVESDHHGAQLAQALTRGAFAQVAESMSALQALLNTIDATQSESMARLLALATASGCAAKQSGAGGGDGALVIGPDAPTLEGARASLEARGFLTRPVNVAPGLQGEALVPPQLSRWLEAAE